MVAYDPFAAEKVGPAWRAAHDLLISGETFEYADILAVMLGPGTVVEKTCQNVLTQAAKEMVLEVVNPGSHKKPTRYINRRYRMVPRSEYGGPPDGLLWYALP